MVRRDYELFADYFQFYLQDDDISLGDLSEAWTEDAVARMLAVSRGVIGIGTARNMNVPVTVEVLDAGPARDEQDWDHVVEGGLEVRSGRIVVAGCTDNFPDANRIPVSPGIYRVRVSVGGLDTISDDGLAGRDRYRVQLWAASELANPTILKLAPSR